MEFPMRINKYLAHTGVASRRESDLLIEQKKVQVNGAAAKMGQQINEDDKVVVLGKTKTKIYLAYYKGRGVITHSPDEDEVDIVGLRYRRRDYYFLRVLFRRGEELHGEEEEQRPRDGEKIGEKTLVGFGCRRSWGGWWSGRGDGE